MNTTRQERLLRDLKMRYRDAQRETDEIAPEEWERLESLTLSEAENELKSLSSVSHEHRLLEQAMILLFPYREAWKAIRPYRSDILEAEDPEQRALLQRIMAMIADHSRMTVPELKEYIYVFWPVREHAGV